MEGEPERVGGFLDRLGADAPPLAVVERVEIAALAPLGERSFAIRESPRGAAANAPVTPDAATCADCLRELFDPRTAATATHSSTAPTAGRASRSCAASPTTGLTTMAGFEMCAACRAEYEDPADRRFHAQPNACPVCGPSVPLIDSTARMLLATAGLADQVLAADRAGDGAIVAVKGIGGFHLACRADDETAVSALRARKHREDKPFALMVASVDELRVGGAGRGRARAVGGAAAADRARRAPRPDPRGRAVGRARAPELGVMLPYSPLHHLLLADVGGTLVMTSGNVSDEPIAYGDEDAFARLAGIADMLLVHDRPIETRTDDSVIRAVAAGGRRRRGGRRSADGHSPLARLRPREHSARRSQRHARFWPAAPS